jgi:XTP/dITP diphosphohydrolase
LGDYQVDDSDFVEDGMTHEENARKKAKYYFEKVGDGFDFVIGEDSGIYVDALKDELGVQTRRWGAGDAASDEEWLEYFMKEMKVRAPAFDQRGAKFVCCACVVGRVGAAGSGTLTRLFKGETLGLITDSVMAPILPGLPLSSVFLPEGFDKVYAALSREEKNKISHRGQAVGKVREWLLDL